MTGSEGALAHRRLRAPGAHGQALVEPTYSEIGQLLSDNLALQLPAHLFGDRPTDEVRRVARLEMLRAARRYTAAYRDLAADPQDDSPILLAGHQPQLFHAGVWFKNFALSRLADAHQAVAVNLIIDNDLCRTTDVRTPSRRGSAISFVSTPFDTSDGDAPFEEREIRNRGLFASFGDRVRDTLGDLVPAPIIDELWPLAERAADETGNLGASLAQSRHALEGRLGLQTLELPLSAVCKTEAFSCFVAQLLLNGEQFRDIHNEALAEYRRLNHIRSQAHPAPPLAEDGNWIESPFWIWSSDDPTRRRLFAQRVSGDGKRLRLTDRQSWRQELAFDNFHGLVEQLLTLEESGRKLRPRALTTTMFSRLLLSDLFAHGIGGAKYDQLTDEIIIRFFKASPPAFLVLSATAQLPLPRRGFEPSDLENTRRNLRELQFQPEKHIKPTAEVADLITEKHHWVQQCPPRGAGKPRRQAINNINRELQPFVAQQRRAANEHRDQLIALRRRDRQLASREFSFCLHSRKTLPDLLLALSSKPP